MLLVLKVEPLSILDKNCDGLTMDEYEEQMPITYATVEDAINAILMDDDLRALFEKPKLNWDAAAAAIISVEDLPLDAETFLRLLNKTDNFNGKRIFDVLLRWGNSNWSMVKSAIHEKARTSFANEYFHAPDYDQFCEIVRRWPRLQDDSEFLEKLLSLMARNPTFHDGAIQRLQELQHDQVAAGRVLAIIMESSTFLKTPSSFAALAKKWAGDTTWGQLNILLWTKVFSNSRLEVARNIESVASLLEEFGILSSPNNYKLSQLSPESRASWRRDLKAAVGDDENLRSATAEALLGLGAPHDDRAVLFAIMELYRDGLEEKLLPFLSHSNRLVRRRVQAVIDLFRLEPDVMELFQARSTLARQKPLMIGRQIPRTWIGDPRIEQIIETALEEAAQLSGEQILSNLDCGEETHLMLLLGELKAAFGSITNLLASFAAEASAPDHLSFELDLDYRVVGKHEEGGVGVGTESFSTDLCLLIEARDAGKLFARRASLIQAKRLYSPDKNPYYPVKLDQLKDLSGQTLASFLVLLGPARAGVKIPVIPARLVLDLIERGEPATSITSERASELGKGIGTWLVEDAIGLWTGDWSQDIVERAEGRTNRRPLKLVRLVVDRIPRGPEDW